MVPVLIFAGVVLFFLVFYVILAYNGLVAKKNQVENVFASADALLKKRHDLIPNLVAAVQNYVAHESRVLTEVTRLRSKANSPGLSDDDKVDLENRITRAVGQLYVAVENYPDLKANQNFIHLQSSMNEVEEQISAARRAYNAVVTAYNNAVEMFPSNIVAGIFKFSRKNVFEIPEYERETPDVKSLFKS